MLLRFKNVIELQPQYIDMLEVERCDHSSMLVFAFLMDSFNMYTAASSPTALLRRTGELWRCYALLLTAPQLGWCFMKPPPMSPTVPPHCWRCSTVLTPPYSCSHRWCWEMRDSCSLLWWAARYVNCATSSPRAALLCNIEVAEMRSSQHARIHLPTPLTFLTQ